MIAIINYNAGNIRSVQNALKNLGYQSVITNDIDVIKNASKVILPGVGEAKSAMQFLKEKGLDEVILSLKQPFLGICLGLQLMCKHSEEGDVACLGIFNANVRLFPPRDIVPHMGWNNLVKRSGKLTANIQAEEDVYFVHSYFAEISRETTAVCDYIQPFSAVMEDDNFYATQFHPEKSSKVGEQILLNFLKL
ncbi:imidazole glycerol phosphate synthase subunit HisH [Putridiphycobacter roseus]|uniref:Imidazole glycerol phosphate synthase subunit HisH n=1 Tax=Putridiphycobacter roseus TaxID=2219161 RepID=A0A2W1NN49_9FLAO|nr:imidazole glycerol phosphate synthase subunit HisH [Putridiphycobacter roseus]PZE15988.1 imidazole glycerol phosphate synthase subunit HisH [Putridiphycobacter roseus]